jgi:Tfp pilus assembly protein PilZ
VPQTSGVVATPDEQRPRRVRFKHPVRVTTVEGEARAWRTLSANLSRDGLFVRMPQPLEPGTRVAISLEANGQVLPFMQGEVRWCRYQPSEHDGRYQGIGVRFTDALHPRANELIEYLVDSLETGKPLVAAPRRRRRWPLVAAGVALAASLAGALAWFGLETPAPVLPSPSEGAGSLSGLSAAPQAHDAIVAMVSPATDPASDMAEAVDEPIEPEAPPRDEAPAAEVAPPKVAEVPPEPAPTDAPRTETLPAVSPELAEPPAAAVAKQPSAPAPSPAPAARVASPEGQLALPSGAARSVRWSPSPDGLELRPELRADAQVARVFALSNPPRVVFDIDGAAPKSSHTATAQSDGVVSRVRIGKQGARTRVVIDLSREPHRVLAAGDHAIVQF